MEHELITWVCTGELMEWVAFKTWIKIVIKTCYSWWIMTRNRWGTAASLLPWKGCRIMMTWNEWVIITCKVPTGQEKLEKSRNLCGQGKVGENDLEPCKLEMSVIFVSPNIKKQANFQLPLNVQKLEVFRLQKALPLCPPLNQGLRRLHIAPLIRFHYLMI